MTKEELKQEAEEYADKYGKSNFDIWDTARFAYYQSAEPREKQIHIDAEQIRALQKQNGELTDELTKKSDTNHQLVEQMAELNEKCSELESQIEKMKCCGNCVHFDFNEPNYCHKGVYRERQYVCGEWCFGN